MICLKLNLRRVKAKDKWPISNQKGSLIVSIPYMNKVNYKYKKVPKTNSPGRKG